MAEIVFSVKEFKAMLTLCESLNAHVQLEFKEPEQPLVVAAQTSGGGVIKARLLVSTIDNPYPSMDAGRGVGGVPQQYQPSYQQHQPVHQDAWTHSFLPPPPPIPPPPPPPAPPLFVQDEYDEYVVAVVVVVVLCIDVHLHSTLI